MSSFNCDIKNIFISISEIKGECSYKFQKGQIFLLKDLFPDNLCMHAFYSFYPYYFTLKNKGWFEWVKPQGGVFANCPNPDGIIAKFSLTNEGEVDTRIVKKQKKCISKYQVNDRIELITNSFCASALYVLYPYINQIMAEYRIPWSKDSNSCLISCPSAINNVIFEIKGEKN